MQASGKTPKRLGTLIRERRLELGMTAEALADAVQGDRFYMSRIERGLVSFPKSYLIGIASALHLDIMELAAAGNIYLDELIAADLIPDPTLVMAEPTPPVFETPMNPHPRWFDRAYFQELERQVA